MWDVGEYAKASVGLAISSSLPALGSFDVSGDDVYV